MADDELRTLIEERLSSDLAVQFEPRAYTHEAIQELVGELRALDVDDLDGRLRIGGFTLDAYGEGEGEQACETCMYYQVHRRFCELPELMLPVEPGWSCRLWRI